MKTLYIKLLVVLALVFSPSLVEAQTTSFSGIEQISSDYDNDSKWRLHGGKEHLFTMNYTMFGKAYANGLWTGGLGYATGMWLSGNKTAWGVVGSLVGVNLPILLDGDYDKPELWVGANLGAITVSVSATFIIEVNQRGKLRFAIPDLIRRR
jgi:hypothetical protein